jgi:hypothetical protein
VRALQSALQAIHGVEAPRAEAFLMGREAAGAAGHVPRAPEALLVLEEGDQLSLGLVIDDEVVRGAARGELAALAYAVEGVSHFVYLATRAARGQRTSLLELEVQAEVDKFALLVLALWRRGRRCRSPALRRRLFEEVAWRDHLASDELSRYREANRLGGGYARWLEGRFVDGADAEGLLRELRRSYRLAGGEKLGYLGTRALQ